MVEIYQLQAHRKAQAKEKPAVTTTVIDRKQKGCLFPIVLFGNSLLPAEYERHVESLNTLCGMIFPVEGIAQIP